MPRRANQISAVSRQAAIDQEVVYNRRAWPYNPILGTQSLLDMDLMFICVYVREIGLKIKFITSDMHLDRMIQQNKSKIPYAIYSYNQHLIFYI